MQQSQPCAICGGSTSYTPGGAAEDGVWFYPGVRDRTCMNSCCEGANPVHQWRLLPELPELATLDAHEHELTGATEVPENEDDPEATPVLV